MEAIQLTNDQKQAVYNRGGSLLVSAAAGSGKTKVLVERLFAYMEEERCHVDDFLIITYTKAAAAELRGKIAKELSKRVAEEPNNRHLRQQMFRVYQADIKTVDAFCASLLRENVRLLPTEGKDSLTPDFRVLDESESLTMKERVLGRVLEEFYQRLEQDDGDAALLAQTLGAGRDDRMLETLVLEMHSKIQSHPYPLAWLSQEQENWRHLPEHLADSAYGRVIMDDTVRRALFWAERLERAAEEMEACPAVASAYADRFMEVAAELRRYEEAAQQGWEAMGEIQPVFRRMGSVRGEENAYHKERAKTVLEQCKKDLKKMTAVYAQPEQEHMEDLRAMAPAMVALLQLTADFTHAYQKEKLHRNAMDFSDQEHFAIEILLDADGAPTPLARQLSTRYREIMVDEYQDTNAVQNCIFNAISREGKNLFVVGDVKQSIYRFRLADPTIFLEKYLAYAPAETAEEGAPRKVLLSRNFRSRTEVLETTNFIFENIMSPQMGEMEYGEEERLNFGAEYYLPRADVETEFHLVSVANTEEENFDRQEMEARFVAGQIRKMLDEGVPVQDGDGLRPAKPEDIVILMRSPRARQKTFTEALKRENIPCSTSENESLFATMEIAVMFSLLQIIDNPRQDVPLISVLRSPLFGFTPDRLAQIRALCPTGDYYDALCADTAQDSAAFCALLQELRTLAHDLAIDRLVWEIYSRLHVPAVFGAMNGGRQRKDNLTAFYAYASRQAATGQKSVFDFVAQLRKLLENGEAPLLHTQASTGGVQIMSIHKSKGLEFPIVFLCDMQKTFNAEDSKRPVLVHPTLGLGTERVEPERRIRYDTISKAAVAKQMKRESLAEEMRILYVAMTRAKEKLVIVDCMKSARKHIRDLLALTDLPVPPEAVGAAKCPGDWLLLPLLNSYEAGIIHQWAGMEPHQRHSTYGGWKVRLWENPVTSVHGEEERAEETAMQSAPDLSGLRRGYAHTAACTVPSKITATQLKGRELDEEIAQGTASPHLRRVSIGTPRFLQAERTLSAAERGTAMHLAMQYLDFSAQANSPEEQVRRLQERHLLTEQQAQAVDCRKLQAFLDSPLAQRIRSAAHVWREYPFALLLPATLYESSMDPSEQMLLQGVVDCCYETEAGLAIVDFKTDRIRPGEEAQRAEVYRPQLEAYARALTEIFEMPVAEQILYFFATGTEISLK